MQQPTIPPSSETVVTKSPRWLWIGLAVLASIVVVGTGFAIFSKHSAPRAARLLPESDGLVYVNLGEVRSATHFDRKPITPGSDYQSFVAGSGVEFERDLDEAAFAVHRLENPLTAQGPFSYSEVFVGHFDSTRLTRYLQSQADGTEIYLGRTIFSIPHDSRVVRVSILDRKTVAVSNAPTPEQIHEILDHHRAWCPAGPTILQDHFRDVPVFSFAWGLGKIAAPLTGDGNAHLLGFRIPLPTNTVFIASARYIEALHLRIDEFAPNETVAASSATVARTVLSFYKGEQRLRSGLGGQPDGDIAALLQTLQVTQKEDRASLTATVPLNLLRRLLTP